MGDARSEVEAAGSFALGRWHVWRIGYGSPPGDRFDAQLAALVPARDEGLIDGIGLRNIAVEHEPSAGDGSQPRRGRSGSGGAVHRSRPAPEDVQAVARSRVVKTMSTTSATVSRRAQSRWSSHAKETQLIGCAPAWSRRSSPARCA